MVLKGIKLDTCKCRWKNEVQFSLVDNYWHLCLFGEALPESRRGPVFLLTVYMFYFSLLT